MSLAPKMSGSGLDTSTSHSEAIGIVGTIRPVTSCDGPPIFVSTACVPGTEPLRRRLSSYERHGIRRIELGAGVLAESRDEGELRDLVGTGFRFLVHNYFPPPPDPFVLNLASRDEAVRERSLGLVADALALSARLGAPFYSVHAGFVTEPIGFGETSFVFPMPASMDEERQAMGRFVKTLETVLTWAKKLGVQLLVENNVCSDQLRGRVLVKTAEDVLQLFGALPSPHLGMLLDTGHLNVSARTLGFDRASFVDRVAPYVRAIHVHDNDGVADTHQPLRRGSWVLRVLRRPEFLGLPIVLEAKCTTVERVQEHMDSLSRQLEPAHVGAREQR